MQSTARSASAWPGKVRLPVRRLALIGAAVLAIAAFVPGLAILIGMLALVASALFAAVPDVRPYLQPVVRVPVGSLGLRRAWLTAIGVSGVVLVVIGSIAATARGHVKSEWAAERRRQQVGEADAQRLLARARDELQGGSVGHAELTLMEAQGLSAVPDALRAELDGLYERVQRSGDARFVLEVLVSLPPADFEAFVASQRVPAGLDFPERVLTLRAVGLGLAQVDVARRARTAPTTASAPR